MAYTRLIITDPVSPQANLTSPSPQPAESRHGWHHTPCPHLCRGGCCWGTAQASPAGMPLIYTQQEAALCPVSPAHAVRLACHSKVTWQEPPAGPGTGSLSLPRPPVPYPSPWPRAGRSSSRKRVKSQRFSSTAQRGSSGGSHCSPHPSKSCELQSYALTSKTGWLWFGGQRG